MLDAFIIDQIEKNEIPKEGDPVPLTIPLEVEREEDVKEDKPDKKIIIQL